MGMSWLSISRIWNATESGRWSIGRQTAPWTLGRQNGGGQSSKHEVGLLVDKLKLVIRATKCSLDTRSEKWKVVRTSSILRWSFGRHNAYWMLSVDTAVEGSQNINNLEVVIRTKKCTLDTVDKMEGCQNFDKLVQV